MSYCVNCGVELHPTAKSCPLCGTEVLNPRQKEEPKIPTPFSQVEEILPTINRRSLGWLITALLLMPNIVCSIINLLYYKGTFWSIFVIGATMVIWVEIALPLFMKKSHPILGTFLTGVSASLYILLIAIIINGPEWFLHLALPISVLVNILSVISAIVYVKKKPGILVMTAVVLTMVSILVVGIEIFVDLYLYNNIHLIWSLITAASLMSFVILIIVIRRNVRLREELRKKLHV